MRERFSIVDPVGRASLNQATPLITCKYSKPMERAKNGARYFRNPPQPHMCIQDFIQGSKDPCYINVLSWIKISTPRRPEDPIPLYGGMRIPCSNTVPIDKKNFPKKQPTIFAVMANPEILRLSGKTAKDPMDRDALVDLMLDFVEAMNPEVKFKREFTVLKDRDLTGELKDIWLAIQVKREREKEKAENGKKLYAGDREKHKDVKDEKTWQDSDKQQEVKTVDQGKEKDKCTDASPLWFSMEHDQNMENGSKDGTEDMEPKNTILTNNQIHTKTGQGNGKKHIVSYEDKKEENMVESAIPLPSFNTDNRKLGDAAVREVTNSMHTACEGSVTPSRDSKGSPTHQRKSKLRSYKGELFTQTVQHSDEAKTRKGGEFSSDVPCANEISTVTKHTMFKEIFPSSSDSSEDEERGDFRMNNIHKARNNGSINSADSKNVSFPHDSEMLNDSRLDDGDIGVDIIDTVENENESGSDRDPNSSHNAACMGEACSYENADFESRSNVKPCKFLRMKSSAIKRLTDKQLSSKQNVYVANKFKNPEQADSVSAKSCQVDVPRF